MQNIRNLGRRIAIDPRDRKFALQAPQPSSTLTKMFWYTSPAFDQGQKPQCVAYAGVKFLDSGPIRNLVSNLPFNFDQLYHECQLNDEWPGEDYDGTSVRALFKVLKTKGLVSRYEWAFDIQTMVNYILTTGPMVVGTNWTNSMFYPEKNGFIRVTGSVIGGHAYLLKGVNTLTKCPDGTIGAFRIINSFGSSWGVRGCASISFADFKNLLTDGGEAATATELKVV